MGSNSIHIHDISAVIISWNTKDLLIECIKSLIAETRNHTIEIIVVDNASADGSPEEVRSQFPDIKLICNDSNLGFAKANNIGIRQSNGRYVCIINSDIKAVDGCLDRLCAYMEQEPAIGMIGPVTVNEDFSIRYNCRRFPSLWNCFTESLFLHKIFPGITCFSGRALAKESYSKTHDADTLSGCFLMVRRTALETVGLLDERFFFYGEDVDWCLRFYQAGWRVVFHPEAKAIHYGGASTAAEPVKYHVQMEKSDLQYWNKHFNHAIILFYKILRTIRYAISLMACLFDYLLFSSNRTSLKDKMSVNVARLRTLISFNDI